MYESLIPIITVDSRETAIADALEQYHLFEIERKQLDIGDVVMGDLTVERKSQTDFAVSLADGRLFQQLTLMRRLCQKRLLIIEGLTKQTLTPSQQGALVRISVSLQIPIFHSSNEIDTARILQRAALQLFGFTVSSLASRRDPRAREYYQVYVLAGFPGVGLKRARTLLAHFGNLREVFNASQDTLCAVEGIGPVLAEQLSTLITARHERTSGTEG